MSDPIPQKPDLEQRALASVNQGESWFKANLVWLGAVLVAAVAGFILGHVV